MPEVEKEKLSKPTERQIVNHIVEHWKELMDEDLHFFRKEMTVLDNWRCDIVGYLNLELGEEYGYDKPHPYRAPVFIEAKYNSDSRDLIYEMQKALGFVQRNKLPMYIGVISDDFSDTVILDFLIANGIHLWKIDVLGNDLSTMKVEYYEPNAHENVSEV